MNASRKHKDFTPDQAAKWIRQELGKVDLKDADKVSRRIMDEEKFISSAERVKLNDIPVLLQAHRDFVLALRRESA